MERSRRTRLMSVLILTLVFGTGFVLGLAFDRTAAAMPAGLTAEREEKKDDDDRERRRPMYKRVGELTEEQEARIDVIVDQHRERMDALQKEFRDSYNPRYYEIVENTRDAIKGVMTAEQAQRYDSLLVEWEKRRERLRNDSRDDADQARDSSRD